MSRIVIVTRNLSDDEIKQVIDELQDDISDCIGGLDNSLIMTTSDHDDYDLDLGSVSMDSPEPIVKNNKISFKITFNKRR
jgi:hypothetical protein